MSQHQHDRRTKRFIAKESIKLMRKLAKLGPGAIIVAVLNPSLPREDQHTYIVVGGNADANQRTLENILRLKLKDGRTLERDRGDEPDDEELDQLNMEAWLEENKKKVDELKTPTESITETRSRKPVALEDILSEDDFIRMKMDEIEKKKKKS
jgi:hypothetical protein